MNSMSKLNAILVDDEQDSRAVLANYLAKYCPEVKLLHQCDSVVSAKKVIEQYNLELSILFLDIEMPYANGFDLLDQLEEINFEVVFVTAYDNYAIKALNQSAAYYILKPIDIDELINAVEKIKNERNNKSGDYQVHAKLLLENVKNDSELPKKLMLPTQEGYEVVKVVDIIYCEADNNFTMFYLEGGRKLLICRTLKYFEGLLSTNVFLRIHRSYIVNTEKVIRYNKGKGGYVTLENAVELEVSPKKKKELLLALQH